MIAAQKHQRPGVLVLLGVGLIFSAACKKAPATPAAQPAETGTIPSTPTPPAPPFPRKLLSESEQIARIKSSPTLTAEQKSTLLATVPESVARDQQEIKDRRELVLPPPAGWKPESVRLKIRLTLIPEKTMVHKGAKFRYRLETQNVGKEPVTFFEDRSAFVKSGSLYGSWYRFYATLPDGREKQLRGAIDFSDESPLQEYHFPSTMTSAEKDAAFKKIQLQETAEDGIALQLLPGETLVTRPDPPPPNRFRDLDTSFKFDKPGTYRIKVAFEDPPPKPDTEEHIQAMIKNGVPRERVMKLHEKSVQDSLGIVESNMVSLEVVP